VASRVYFSLICRKQANYVYDEKTEKQPKVLEFGPLLIGTVFAPGKAHFRAVRKNRPVSASTPQSGDYLLLNAATAHEFRSPNAHADDIGTGGLWGVGSIILAIEGVTELPILINETIKCVNFSPI